MKYLSLIPILLITSSVHSESFLLPYEAICDDTKIIIQKLRAVNEVPITVGETSDVAGTTMVLWMNMSTKAWTITATKSEMTCVIGTGEQLKFVTPQTSV